MKSEAHSWMDLEGAHKTSTFLAYYSKGTSQLVEHWLVAASEVSKMSTNSIKFQCWHKQQMHLINVQIEKKKFWLPQ